jgi:hypothetical protein
MVTWRVESVSPSTEFVAGGNAVEGSRVTFVTGSGTPGFVFVPRAQMADTDAVAAMVAEAAQQVESVRNLTG